MIDLCFLEMLVEKDKYVNKNQNSFHADRN